MGRPVWIYALVDPRTETVRYIGQSSEPAARFASHTSQRAAKRVRRWVSMLRASGVEPRMDMLCLVHDEGDALHFEWAFIDMHEATVLNMRVGVIREPDDVAYPWLYASTSAL